MSSLRILFIEPPAEKRVGGIETALAGWAGSLNQNGHAVIRRDGSISNDELRDADIVHFHGIWERSHPELRAQCQAIGKPFVISPHGMLEPWAFAYKGWKKRPYFHFREKPSMRRADAILATSESEAQVLRRWFSVGQVKVLPLGLPETPGPDYAAARAHLGWTENERVVVFLSRLHEKKGLHLLVEAWGRISQQIKPPLRLVIVGDGEHDYVKPLRRLTDAMTHTQVDWVGPQWGDAKWPWLQAADCFCLPTYSENFGLVVPEALLVGTPVLTTPGTPWGELGRGLPVTITRPDVADLSCALIELLKTAPADAHHRAHTHAEIVARFGWSRLAIKYETLYRSLIATSVKPHAC